MFRNLSAHKFKLSLVCLWFFCIIFSIFFLPDIFSFVIFLLLPHFTENKIWCFQRVMRINNRILLPCLKRLPKARIIFYHLSFFLSLSPSSSPISRVDRYLDLRLEPPNTPDHHLVHSLNHPVHYLPFVSFHSYWNIKI